MNYRHVYMHIIAHAKLEMKEGKRPSEYQKKKDFPVSLATISGRAKIQMTILKSCISCLTPIQ